VLLVLALEPNVALDSVQVQRVLFLLACGCSADKPAAYGFRSSLHGPVSVELYLAVSSLVASGDIVAIACTFPTYMATTRGFKRGSRIRESLSPELQTAVGEVANLVRNADFISLGANIQGHYPEFFLDRTT
jgi:hypothetical protein